MLNFRCEKTIKLIKALREHGIAYTVAVGLLKKKDVKVNGRRVSENVELHCGDFVEVYRNNRDESSGSINRIVRADAKSDSLERPVDLHNDVLSDIEREDVLHDHTLPCIERSGILHEEATSSPERADVLHENEPLGLKKATVLRGKTALNLESAENLRDRFCSFFEGKEAPYGGFYAFFEDERLLVICKGKGISVVGTGSLSERLRELYGAKTAPCHRLDTNTTGLVLFAKDEDTLKYLTDQMEKHRIVKKYKCVVCGVPERKKARLRAFLFKDRRQSRVYVSGKQSAGAMEILTDYRLVTVDRARNLALLEVEIFTGRTHQIRAHLASIGYPLLGDGKYGRGEINRRYRVSSQMLCAYYLRLDLDDNPDYQAWKGLEFRVKPEFDSMFE